MSCILNIETSTNVCSVALSENGACIYEQEDHSGPNHGERLGTFVDEPCRLPTATLFQSMP